MKVTGAEASHAEGAMFAEPTSSKAPNGRPSEKATKRKSRGRTAVDTASIDSGRWLRDFIEGATVAMHSVSGDGTIIWANQAELDLLGYSREEYIGSNIVQFHADKPVIDDILVRLGGGETLRAYSARLLCKNGSIKYVAIDSSVSFENGKFVHTRCITRDVTREVLAEQKLREAEHWFRNLVEALPVAVYTTDAEGFITHYNQQAAQLAGRSAEIGKDKWCVTHRLYRTDGTFLPHEDCPMAMALRTGMPIRGAETVAERPDGTRVYLMPHPTPLRDEAGKVIGGVNVLIDITGRKLAEDTRAHLAAIKSHGPSPWHRLGFKPFRPTSEAG